jgi:3-deoxy-D-manno-octulosonic-acid transferase
MSIDLKVCSEEELWYYIASHLKRKGIDTVLVGGAVVSKRAPRSNE